MNPQEQEEAKAIREQIAVLEARLTQLHVKAFCRALARKPIDFTPQGKSGARINSREK